MRITLRQQVRAEVGLLIRQEQTETAEVLAVTGLVPSSVSDKPAHNQDEAAPDPLQTIDQERAAILRDLKRRIRYILTFKARPPFCLAGIEMVERLAEVESCLATLIAHLNPEGKPTRSADEVHHPLFAYLDQIQPERQLKPQLRSFYQTMARTTDHCASGLFTCYDLPGFPRTNNDRESEFRDLTRRLLRTTGQKGLVQRILQRQGAWELLPRPDSLSGTVAVLRQVTMGDFRQERQRVRDHRSRFRLYVRSARQSGKQLGKLAQRWTALPQGGPWQVLRYCVYSLCIR